MKSFSKKNKIRFSFRHYEEILKTANQRGFKFVFFTDKPPSRKVIYLRHDIDVSLENALEIAKIERKNKIHSTFFIRTHSSFYNPVSQENINKIKEILTLGHKIGLHYDGLIKKNLEKMIQEEFSYLQNYFPISNVVSFHHPDQRVFGLELKGFINTYSPYFFKECEYISDSNRELKRGCIKEFIEQTTSLKIQILTHPIWWNEKSLNLRQIYQNLLKKNKKELVNGLKDDIKCYKDFFR